MSLGVQVFSPEHDVQLLQVQAELQVRDWVPHLPQAWVPTSAGLQIPLLVQTPQLPQVQELVQVRTWEPQLPQTVACWLLGLHTPAPEQGVHAPHVQKLVQMRVWLPQLPQDCFWVDSGLQPMVVPAHVPLPSHVSLDVQGLASLQAAPFGLCTGVHLPPFHR